MNSNEKCGEIFSLNKSQQLSIVCTIESCDFKVYNYEDFLRHLHYVHSYEDTEGLSDEKLDCAFVKTEKYEDENDELAVCDQLEEEYLIDELSLPIVANDDERLSINDNDIDRISIERTRSLTQGKVKQETDNTSSESEGNETDNYDVKDESFELDEKPKGRKRIKYKRDQPTDFQCDICQKYYFSAVTLRVHRRSVHNMGATDDEAKPAVLEEKCTVCEKEFKDKKSINAHYMTEHGGFICSICGKKFKDKHDHRRHLEIHADTKKYVCDWENCGKRFITHRYLRTHLKVHQNTKNFVCEACGYACRTPDMLRLHRRRHTGEKPYACSQCLKRFASSSAVKEHQATHRSSNDRPHVCNICGAAFGRSKSLYHHKHLHDGKKFKCKICDKPFAQLAGLSMHMKKHKEESGLI